MHNMRTTLDIPKELIEEALKVTRFKTKTNLIKFALQNVINQSRLQSLKKYKGKLLLDINLDMLRKR